jgi:hypothetical protein
MAKTRAKRMKSSPAGSRREPVGNVPPEVTQPLSVPEGGGASATQTMVERAREHAARWPNGGDAGKPTGGAQPPRR